MNKVYLAIEHESDIDIIMTRYRMKCSDGSRDRLRHKLENRGILYMRKELIYVGYEIENRIEYDMDDIQITDDRLDFGPMYVVVD
jgi:hypothetical protein